MAEIRTEGLSVSYPLKKHVSVPALDHLSLTFPDGSFSVLLGPSGSGKSTLLKAILGLIPYEGTIYLDDDDLSLYSFGERRFAYVSQEIVLQPSATVFDNIAYPLRIQGMDKATILEKVYALAKEFDLTDCLSRKPKQISLGQAQRTAMARAIIKNASVYLFDEPFSNLDAPHRDEERHYLQKAMRNLHATVIYVTHSVPEATALADQINVLDHGKLVWQGLPDALASSSLPLLQELVKSDDPLL